MTARQQTFLEYVRDNSPTFDLVKGSWRVWEYHPVKMRGHVTAGAIWEITAEGIAALP